MTTKKNASAALEAEANGTIREFEYKGQKYTVESDSQNWSVETMLAYEDGKAVSVVRAILGPEQWAQFMATKPNNKDFNNFTEDLFEQLGLSTGE